MAKVINSKQKLCKIMTNGRIAELGNICGPVTSPCKVDLRKVVNMVQRGLKVYEINPKNYNEQVLLTIKNVTLNNFKEPEKIKYPETPVVEEKVVVVEKQDIVEAVQENIKPDANVEDVIEQIASSVNKSTAEPQKQNNFSKEKYTKNDFKKK